MKITPIIIAGGSGSRLWPLSRQQFPKQFLTLCGSLSMLQATTARLTGIEHEPAIVICNEEHRFAVADQLLQCNTTHGGIILEPVGRNTAPAIALAAFKALSEGEDPLLLVLAADHVIQNDYAFCQSVMSASQLAINNQLVTFGIVPTKPETGYGYIKRGSVLSRDVGFHVAEFVEKPTFDIAQQYVDSGEYYWNSGMFLFKASVYLQELKQHRPDIYTACERAMSAPVRDVDFVRVNKAAFEACPDDSIDYAVMENTSHAVVVPMDCGWSGSALWDIAQKDMNGNVLSGDIISFNTRDSYIHATDKLVTTIGLDDVIIIETKDAILVSKKSDVQQVKKIVEQLKSENRNEWQHHREVYRPWGKYDSLDIGYRDQVKRITVKPGAKLSIQMHHHRSEHWIVVSGTAKVTNGEKTFLLTENQSTYIPIGQVHALENPGVLPLEIIEVQSGAYLGEDDIVRFEDRYGRIEGDN